MALVKFSRKEFEKHIKITKEIEEKIAMFGTPLEALTADEVSIEVFPNRPDLLSLQGYLRSFLSFIGEKTGKEYKIKKSNAKIIVDKSVASVRPYCMAAIVKDVKFTNEKIIEIMQWQEKIHATLGRNRKKVALGYYILDKIKFPVKYTTKEAKDIIFTPLYTNEKMNGLQILSRHPAGREYGNQLEGMKKFPVYYDIAGEVLSMPPIINSNNSGKIIPGTSDILIECSGTDLELLKKVTILAVVDLIDAGGEAYSVEVAYGNKKESIDLKQEKMKINLENVNKLLGLELKEKEVEKFLEKMGYKYKNKEVLIPAYRIDVLHEVDLIEDIAIAYGYGNFIPRIPEIAGTGEESREEKLKKKIAEILAGLGLMETMNYHLTNKEEQEKMMNTKLKDVLEIENSKTDYNLLRQNLLHKLMKVIGENTNSEYPQKIFELGGVFEKDGKEETGIKEKEKLCFAITPGNFTEIKQILDYLEKMLGIEKIKIQNTEHDSFIDGRAGKLLIDGKEIGVIGEIHPQVLKNWHLKMPVSACEIDLEEVFKLV